ncbi:MAG: anhydro-N-acetylmuramic acid kinase [Rhodospirillaceae bacterium]|jgi:anhydro-N-acetylmuramic acid kinase|nr:anhydro-N-acetylmuramic acid kinase [Rhodospirillaceae bacterium]MBT7955734.1 anhydro-N-acetylmuramic acid kinase [Rhodospirillaceae bacterium]
MTDAKLYTALGLMSGTSLDGIDAAIIQTDGISVHSFGPFEAQPYDPEFRGRLRAALGAKDVPAELEHDLTHLHAELIQELLKKHNLASSEINIIGFHGQTILHEPKNQFTLQLGDGAKLAELTGCPVVNNFRAADVAAGGEGAPLAPVYHQALAADFDDPVVIVNIGGVGNISFIGADHLLAFDTGPGNALIDDLVLARTGKSFDQDGHLAAKGRVDTAILAKLLSHDFFDQTPPKSLDRNAFDTSLLEKLSLEDAAATLVAFTTAAIARSATYFPEQVNQWLVTGGGRHNPTIMKDLSERLGTVVQPVESVGWNGDAIEAQAFAFMAVRSLLKLPLSFPATTGVSEPITGGILHHPK